MQFRVGFGTDIGRKRQQNQDNGATHPELGLFMVADGMGGHQGGETASSIAVEVVSDQIRKLRSKTPVADPKSMIRDAIRAANHAIHEEAKKKESLAGMGTTTTALLFNDGKLYIGHVGDSRCYFFRSGLMWQLTRDHSLVQEKLRAGIITREQVKTDRMKNVITRSVGFEDEVNVDVYEMEVQTGDTFLICSDGLSGLVEEPEIQKLIQKNVYNGGTFKKTVDELIQQANNNGGDDNITSVVIQVTEAKGPCPTSFGGEA